MASVNLVQLLGNLGADPTINTTTTGKTVATFSLATKGYGADAETDWHRIVAWEKTAELVQQYLKRGSTVHVQGRLKTREYTDKNNERRWVTEIIANSVQFLDKRSGDPVPPPLADLDSDLVPF